MYEYYFTFRSMTAAQQAALILHQSGMEAEFLRAPKQLAEKGCGYALALHKWNYFEAALRLRHAGRQFERVYRIRPGFVPEEVAL